MKKETLFVILLCALLIGNLFPAGVFASGDISVDGVSAKPTDGSDSDITPDQPEGHDTGVPSVPTVEPAEITDQAPSGNTGTEEPEANSETEKPAAEGEISESIPSGDAEEIQE